MKIYFATSNKKKVEEMRYFLKTDLIQLDLEITEIQGNEEDIAIDKLLKACKINKNNFTIIDDCSLDIPGLGGFPGPYFKDFINLGLDVLDKVVDVIGRNSTAKCIIGFGIYKEDVFEYKLFKGSIPGTIRKYNDKHKCFDDLFIPDSIKKPYSSLNKIEFEQHNHRGVACQKLIEHLHTLDADR